MATNLLLYFKYLIIKQLPGKSFAKLVGYLMGLSYGAILWGYLMNALAFFL